MKNKKGMLANLIGGFIVILIGITLIPVISQEINNAMNCNSTADDYLFGDNASDYYGKTDSFGGGGAEHFGGYDGKVVHKNWLPDMVVYKTDKSIINPDCKPLSSSAEMLFKLVTPFFAFAIILMAIGIAYSGLRDSGIV